MNLLLLVLGSTTLLAITAIVPSAPAEDARFLERERVRIQAHLLGAERELLSRDVSGLSPEQRAARARHVAQLRRYREEGIFPHNHEHPGERVPSFVDAHGTRCAMAHLIEASGDTELMWKVARTRNHARIRELADDPELIAWLDRNGLTAAEAARIQPGYGGGDYSLREDTGDRAVWMLAGASGAMSVTTIAFNASTIHARQPAGWAGGTGLVLGLGEVLVGTTVALVAGESRVPWITTAAVGTVTAIVARRALANRRAAPELASSPPDAPSPTLAWWAGPRGPRGAAAGVMLAF